MNLRAKIAAFLLMIAAISFPIAIIMANLAARNGHWTFFAIDCAAACTIGWCFAMNLRILVGE